jgi:hypothetical protein
MPNYVQQPQAFRRNAVFCEFHNSWTNHTEDLDNSATKKLWSMINATFSINYDIVHTLGAR